MPVNTQDYDEIVARVNRKYGVNSLLPGDQMENVAGIPTGSLELDVAMGGKGIPRGRWTRFYGGYHSAKTMTALDIIANAQQMGLTAAYYNVEKQFDPVWAAERGIDTKSLTLVNGTSVEEIGDKMESLLGVRHVHVIDSCTMAVSEDELNADIRDWRPGITARAWGKVFRRLNERFDPVDNTAILIDQMRMDFRTNSENPAGGRVFDHQSSMSVLFRKGSWLFRNAEGDLDEKAKKEVGMSGQTEPSGFEVKARVEKSRVCRPFRTATMWLDLDSLRFDRVFEMVKAAKHYQLVEARGSNFYLDGHKVATSNKTLRDFVRGDLTFQEQIRERALRAGTT